MRHLHLDPSKRLPLLRDQKSPDEAPQALRVSKTHTHPSSSASTSTSQPTSQTISTSTFTGTKPEDASVSFIGTATTIIEWQGLRILTDPNFLHKGDHVHLGPGVTAQRLTNPSVDLHELPPIDLVLLSHYHEDHFDRLVEGKLNRDFVIVTTPHAKDCLTSAARYAGEGEGGPFRSVHDLDHFESMTLHIDGRKHGQVHNGEVPVIKITGMPGKHVPPGPLAVANELLGAVPPTNGWLLEMGQTPESMGKGDTKTDSQPLDTGYRIYISGDTLFVDELKQIPVEGGRIDLMIIHLGGTTIPGPKMPLLMVTMDGKQGVQLMRLLNPDLTIPVHFDDYSVMLSPLTDFQKEVDDMGEEWRDRVVYLDRGEQFRFRVRGS
ncbi:Metallo-hydrolase/oxidoreductase [Xylariaceae sp. AK1471]|nr:Metallo-hydrolase/oxidoreductase [Xylariaceae sp. AK1471]